MGQITLGVNGRRHQLEVDPNTPLLVRSERRPQVAGAALWLRNGAMRGLHRDHARPGGAVLRDAGERRRRQEEITTLEGLGTPEKPHPIQQAFIDEGAAQCGFCLSGVILTAKAVLDGKPDASDEEIRIALGGVLCRCFTHTRMLRAIRKYADAKRTTCDQGVIF